MNYKIYLKDDTSDEVLNNLRNEYNWNGQDMYVLLGNSGQYTIVQSSNMNPTNETDIELAAKKHIQMLEEQEAESLRIEQEEKAKAEEKEQRLKQLEESYVKQTETLQLLTQLVAQLQANQISLSNNTVE